MSQHTWHKPKTLKAYRTTIFVVILSALILLVFWQTRLAADKKRANEVMRSLCWEMRTYRQRTGQLPPKLEMLADNKGDAGWLSNLTNNVAVTYDPGSTAEDRMPRLEVTVEHASIAVQGPRLEYRP